MPKFWGGTAKKMTGDCLAVGIFVSEKENPWTEKEKEDIWAQLEEGLAWLTAQGQEYGITIQFETSCPNWENDIALERVPQIDDDASATHEMANKAAEQLDFESITALYQSIKGEYDDYNIHFMFLGKADGRAHMNSIPIADAAQKLEYNMIYFGPETPMDSFVFAHESLHAYSAMDLYNVYQTKEGGYSEKNAIKRSPDEVMLVAKPNVNESALSEFTAFLVGWHDEPKPWYAALVQPHDEKEFAEFLKNHQHFDEKGELIIEQEDEVTRYDFENGSIVQYTLNGTEELIHWKTFDTDGEETGEYWETSTDDNFFYLEDKNSAENLAIPIQGGMAMSMAEPGTDYANWYELTLAETA